MNQKKIAVFGDLTALYDAKSEFKKNINYSLLDKSIKDYFAVKSLSCARFYTLYHPENQSQVDFVKMLETTVNWEVVTKRPSEVRRVSNTGNPHKNYRFDAQIAYNIGECTGEDYDSITVITDSIELLRPLVEAKKYIGNENSSNNTVNVAFFSDAMDHRWWRGLKESNINFIDLGEIMYNSRNQKPEE